MSSHCFNRDVHAVCLWDDKGPAKIHQALKEDILDFIKQAQAVRASHNGVFVLEYVKLCFMFKLHILVFLLPPLSTAFTSSVYL